MKRIIEIVLSGIFSIMIAIVIEESRFRSLISTNMNQDYKHFAIFISVLIGLALCSLMYSLSIFKLILGRIRELKTPFRKTPIEVLLIIILYSTLFSPVLIGSLNFIYKTEWKYSLNRFPDNCVGILIADFREVSLENYIPQKSFSLFLREHLSETHDSCSTPMAISIYRTDAFFTKADEAISFARKINAMVVIWGEITRSEEVLGIRTRMNYSSDLNWSVGNTQMKPIYFPIDLFERRSTLTSLPDIDTVFLQLKDYLVPPVIAKFNILNLSHDKLSDYLRCRLANGLSLPTEINGMITATLAQNYIEKGWYRPAISLWHETFKNLSMSKSISYGMNEALSSAFHNISICYNKLGMRDSCVFYANKASEFKQPGKP